MMMSERKKFTGILSGYFSRILAASAALSSAPLPHPNFKKSSTPTIQTPCYSYFTFKIHLLCHFWIIHKRVAPKNKTYKRKKI
jgi:hypothetical protein